MRRRGLEPTLQRLAAEGVYLTASEFKGKTEVVRGQLRFRMHPFDGAHPDSGAGWLTQSSGSSNRPLRALSSFEWLHADSATVGAFFAAHRLGEHRFAIYAPPLPGMGAVMFAIMLARCGVACETWFARAIPYNNPIEKAYSALLTRGLALVGSTSGPGFARPQDLREAGASRIVRWVVETRDRGQRSCLRSVASGSVEIARTAL